MVSSNPNQVTNSICEPSLVGRTQERRDVQRPPRQLRQLHEHHPERSVPNNSGRRAVLETQRVLHSRKHGTTFFFFFFLTRQHPDRISFGSEQIKYLRVPDTLLDVVKEEQNRARDTGRGRGGAPGRGGVFFVDQDFDVARHSDIMHPCRSRSTHTRRSRRSWGTNARWKGSWSRNLIGSSCDDQGVLVLLSPPSSFDIRFEKTCSLPQPRDITDYYTYILLLSIAIHHLI